MTRRALVIDDDKLQMLLVCKTLEKHGWRVDAATNGRAGVALMHDARYDIVITDIFMPEQEGIETIRQIRGKFPRMPILVMSGGGADARHDYLRMAEMMGATDSIRKPFTPAALLTRVEQIAAASGGASATRPGPDDGTAPLSVP